MVRILLVLTALAVRRSQSLMMKLTVPRPMD